MLLRYMYRRPGIRRRIESLSRSSIPFYTSDLSSKSLSPNSVSSHHLQKQLRIPSIDDQHSSFSSQSSRYTESLICVPKFKKQHNSLLKLHKFQPQSIFRTHRLGSRERTTFLDNVNITASPLNIFQRPFSSQLHSRSGVFHAVSGCGFAGKPRTSRAEEEMQNQYAGTGEAPTKSAIETQVRQGFPIDSIIGAWVDATLKNGEAGEDALLYQKMMGDGDVIFGVADGVGGWSENGIDPALFSQSLLYHSANYAKDFYACPERLEIEDIETESATSSSHSKLSIAEPGTPLDVLQYAFEMTQEQVEVPAGSATACIVSFDATKGVIRTANLGDSGFLVLRPPLPSHEETELQSDSTGLLTVHYQSKPQTIAFNTPLQLSKLPSDYRSQNSIDCKPSDADLWTGRVQDGDIVLVATDGFWDNVSVAEVLQLLRFIKDKHMSASLDRKLDITNNPLAEEEDLANIIAQNLLSYALMCQFSTKKTSPFEQEAARNGIRYPGGKVDDVAIIVSLVVER